MSPTQHQEVEWTPSWEALNLIAPHLSPETLAAAACVSKSWNSAMSGDHLWRPLCLSHYPSALLLHPSLSPCRLFSLFHTSSRRRHRPSSPNITLHHLLFAIDVLRGNSPILSIIKDGNAIREHGGSVFQFDVDVESSPAVVEEGEQLRVSWTVVMKGLKGAFTMMDRVGKGRVIGGSGRLWFSHQLPGPLCCSSGKASSGIVAELGIEFDKEKVMRSVSLDLLYDVGCRYVSMQDALLYLQPFLFYSS